jgi:peptidoglycan/LPS O-acetylase OafA/YrhL
LSVVALLTLALGIYWAQTNPQAGFYLMPGRVWEFALGALVLPLRQQVTAANARGGDCRMAEPLARLLRI